MISETAARYRNRRGYEVQDDNGPAEEIDLDELRNAMNRSVEDKISPATNRQMLGKMGQNLLLFNQIEGVLKKVLPYVHPRGTAAGDDALEAFRLELTKETLGGTAKLLVQSTKSPEPEAFRAYLKAVVEQRNALVHNFLGQPEIALTESGGRAAIRWLDDQHAFCAPMFQLCERLILTCLGLERKAERNGEELLVPEWRIERH